MLDLLNITDSNADADGSARASLIGGLTKEDERIQSSRFIRDLPLQSAAGYVLDLDGQDISIGNLSGAPALLVTGANNTITSNNSALIATDTGPAIIFTGAGNSFINIGGQVTSTGNVAIQGSAFSDSIDNAFGGTIVGEVLLGAGDDRFASYESSVFGIVRGGDGNDVLDAGFSFTAAQFYGDAGDDALFGGQGDDLLDGGDGDDELNGSFGKDVLLGGAGNDRLIGHGGGGVLGGGSGDDIYFLGSDTRDTLVENVGEGHDVVNTSQSFELAPGQEIEVLQVIARASTQAVTLVGNEFDNEINGNDGVNTLIGGGGADLLVGYGGNDVYWLDGQQDLVVERAGEGARDVVYVPGSFTLFAGQEIEVLSPDNNSGTIELTMVGNPYDNEIYGNNGVNSLFGGGGRDFLVGLGGNDIYYIDSIDDIVFEAVGGGARDLVYTPGSFTLFPGQEIEVLSPDYNAGTIALTMVGNEFDNEIYGNDGINTISGGGGADHLVGLGGSDIYYVDTADIVFEAVGGGARDLVYTPGSFTLFAGQEIEVLSPDYNAGTIALTMIGNEFANEIYGNDGANTIDGGAGADALIGLGGADVYSFSTAPDGTTNIDTIYGYVSGQDSIALDHDVFAGLTVGALAASAFVTGTAAADADDRIIFDPTAATLAFDPDGNGAAPAMVFAVFAGGAPPVTAADIAVV